MLDDPYSLMLLLLFLYKGERWGPKGGGGLSRYACDLGFRWLEKLSNAASTEGFKGKNCVLA